MKVNMKILKKKLKYLIITLTELKHISILKSKVFFLESVMNIKITVTARGRIDKALTESEFQKPALRVIFAGYG
jgi:hypothetical protein